MTKLDHLVWAVPELDTAVAEVEATWRCSVYPGGRHPNWGSHNALVPLRGGSYLEIIAPHPDPPLSGDRVFGIDALTAGDSGVRVGEAAGEGAFGVLQTWALRSQARGGSGPSGPLTALSDAARSQGLELGEILHGSRETPDGVTLRWSLTDPFADRLGGLAPFLIHWGDTPHPSQVGSPEVTVTGLELVHPRGIELERMLMALECYEMVSVSSGEEIVFRATLRTPAGVVELRGPLA